MNRTGIKLSVKYGVIGGILIDAPFLILQYMRLKPLVNLNTMIMEGMLIFIFLYVGTREYRDRFNGGELNFRDGMSVGFPMYIIMAVLYMGFLWVYIVWIDPGFTENYRIEAEQYIRDSLANTTDPKKAELLKQEIGNISNTGIGDLLLDGLLKKIFLGLMLTPVSTVILRKMKG